jgi:hypothetical protein
MTRSLVAVLLWCATATLACASSGPGRSSPAQTPTAATSDYLSAAIIIPSLEHDPTSWTPTESEITNAEPVIQRCVLEKRPDLGAVLPRYARQYSGLLSHGRRELHVGFFDTRFHPIDQLRDSFVIVDDAGDDYFVVVYDPMSQECLRLSL